MFLPEEIIIDGNNFALVSHFATVLSTSGGKPTQAIYGFLSRLSMLATKYSNASFYIVWDSGHEPARKKIFSEYKKREFTEKMKKKFEGFFVQLPEIKKLSNALLHSFDCSVILDGGIEQPVVEADDKIAFLRYIRRRKKVLIVSTDKDFFQLVDDHTAVFTRDRIVQMQNFAEVTGFTNPERYFEARLLLGDASDNIKGVVGVGEKTVKSLLSRCTLAEFLSGKVEPRGFREEKILGCVDVIKRNLRLMKLPPRFLGPDSLRVKSVRAFFTPPSFSLPEVEKILEQNEILSFDAGQIIKQLDRKGDRRLNF